MNQVRSSILYLAAFTSGIQYASSITQFSSDIAQTITPHQMSSCNLYLFQNAALIGFAVSSLAHMFFMQKIRNIRKYVLICQLILICFQLLQLLLSFIPYLNIMFPISQFIISFVNQPIIAFLPVLLSRTAEMMKLLRGNVTVLIQAGNVVYSLLDRIFYSQVKIPFDCQTQLKSSQTAFLIDNSSSLAFSLLFGIVLYLLVREVSKTENSPLNEQFGNFSSQTQQIPQSRSFSLNNFLQSIQQQANVKYSFILAVSLGQLLQFTAVNLMLQEDFSANDIMHLLDYENLRDNWDYLQRALRNQQILAMMMNFAALLFIVPFVEKFGRRVVLLNGCYCCCFVLVVLAIFSFVFSRIQKEIYVDINKQQTFLEVLDMLRVLILFCYEFGPGVIFWVAISEYFPKEFELVLTNIALFSNYICQLLQTGFSSLIDDYIYIIYLFDAINLILWIWITRRSMPESAGMKIDDIQESYFEHDGNFAVVS